MNRCKQCDREIDEAQAASQFDLRFLPFHGRTPRKRHAKYLAGRVGPLCQNCLARRKDLAD
jgi:transposase-like protein